jgi:hypothetical protein
LRHFSKEVLLRKPCVGFSSLLLGLLERSDETPQISPTLIPVYEDITLLQRYIRDEKKSLIGKILSNFLGYGEGLTPSGDDFVIGFLLSLNRWQDLLWLPAEISSLNHEIVETAYQKTTTLSANLIECASLGQGDARLIDAVDYLICGSVRRNNIVTNLLKWGNSSGVDTFLGMAVAFSAVDESSIASGSCPSSSG